MTDEFIHKNSFGVYHIQATRVTLDTVVIAFRRGDSPELICSQYPALTLDQVRMAIAFYLANKERVDEYLKQQDEIAEYWRRKTEENPPPVVLRLRAMKATREAQRKSPEEGTG